MKHLHSTHFVKPVGFGIIQASEVQKGDFIFTNAVLFPGVQCCSIVLDISNPHEDITEFEVLVMGDEKRPTKSKIGLRHDTKVGVVRPDYL